MSEDNRFCLVDANGTEMPSALVNGQYRFGKSKHEPAPTLEAFASGIINHGRPAVLLHPKGAIRSASADGRLSATNLISRLLTGSEFQPEASPHRTAGRCYFLRRCQWGMRAGFNAGPSLLVNNG